MIRNRRQFLTTLSLAGAASLVRAPPSAAAEGSLETTTVRLMRAAPGICHAPQLIAKELLHAEGFTDVSFVDAPSTAGVNDAIAQSKIDFNLHLPRSSSPRSTAALRSPYWRARMSAASN